MSVRKFKGELQDGVQQRSGWLGAKFAGVAAPWPSGNRAASAMSAQIFMIGESGITRRKWKVNQNALKLKKKKKKDMPEKKIRKPQWKVGKRT